MKRLSVFAFVLAFALSVGALCGCSASPSSSSEPSPETAADSSQSMTSTARTIVDMAGNTVEIPNDVHSVGTSWPGFINTICVAGGAENITAAPKALGAYPWATKIFPSLAQANVAFAKEANLEKLASDKPDVLFLRKQDDIKKISELGIPVVMVQYKNNSIYDMVDAVKLVGEVLGGEHAKQAERYSAFVEKNVNAIKTETDSVSDSQKPSVLMLTVKEGAYSTWGKNIIQNEEIQIAGGVNVAADEVDGAKEVTTEQILSWNPDYIFLEGSAQDKETFMSDAAFGDLDAVQHSRVYTTPKGVFSWCRLGSETALYEIWMAQTLYPDKLASLDVEAQAKDFYKTFFNYDLTDAELGKILNAENPE